MARLDKAFIRLEGLKFEGREIGLEFTGIAASDNIAVRRFMELCRSVPELQIQYSEEGLKNTFRDIVRESIKTLTGGEIKLALETAMTEERIEENGIT